MTSQCNQTLGLNLFHPLIDLDGFITNCGSEWIIRGGAWLHILFIAVAAPQMDRWQFFFLPSPQPPLWWDLTKSQIIDENFVLKCSGALFVLHSSLATSLRWFTIIGWSTGNYLDNLASLRFSTDNGQWTQDKTNRLTSMKTLPLHSFPMFNPWFLWLCHRCIVCKELCSKVQAKFST